MGKQFVTRDRGEVGSFKADLRPEALALPVSGIAEVFQLGRARSGLIPLYVGEGDIAASEAITEAIARSLAKGETFYTAQAGMPDLRAAIARYMSRHYGEVYERHVGPFGPERFFVTVGGMHALQLAVRLVAGLGDEVVVPLPAWPNFFGVLAAAGAQVRGLPLDFIADGEGGWRWSLDLDRLRAAISPAVRAIVINSPANPTGWTATRAELAAILDIAREFGLWIIADEIYGRIHFSAERAASFHDVMTGEDRILFVQTFSKNWAMTGLRLGWLEVPQELGEIVENLILYSTSGIAVPLQRAGIAALDQGEDFFADQLARMRQGRDILCEGLTAMCPVRFAPAEATFYLFASFEGIADTRRLALRLIEEAGVGVAPGSAFGDGGEHFVRISFARSPEEMAEAVRRMHKWFAAERLRQSVPAV
jgi:aspartate/methionine/tyrosine aminotransferase